MSKKEIEFIPYNEEWEKEMMRLPKKAIVSMYKKSRLEYQNLSEIVDRYNVIAIANHNKQETP